MLYQLRLEMLVLPGENKFLLVTEMWASVNGEYVEEGTYFYHAEIYILI
jgi:hypothetical protein